MSLLHML